MGTKRPIDSGRVDKNGKKIMVSGKSTQNTDMKRSAIQGDAVPVDEELSERDQYVADIVESGDDFANHKDELIALGVDPKVFSDQAEVRQQTVWAGKDLDILIHDKDKHVREAVAWMGYNLDVLAHDKDWEVREAVAKQGHSLDILVHDEHWEVREAVAGHGYGLDILIHDEVGFIRMLVARKGHGLDILINDKEGYVREAARNKLAELGNQK